jgi:RND superfamily putative drug exporter
VFLRRLGHALYRRRVLVLVLALVLLVVAGVLGQGAAGRLTAGGFQDPSAQSSQARAVLDRFGTGTPNVVLVVTATNGNVDDPRVEAFAQQLLDELRAAPGVSEALSYWSTGKPPPLRSKTGNRALVLGTIPGNEDKVKAVAAEIGPRFTRTTDVAKVEVGGAGAVFVEVSKQAETDLKKAETLSLPITLLLLVFVFGGVVAASLPLAVAALAVVCTFLLLTIITRVTDVSIFALNLTTALGLGLAIDYSLFIVSRYREELGHGHGTEAALVRTMVTAGRTVAFSALTVAASLVALLVFPMAYLRSFAWAGVGVVLLAAAAAVLVLPALLAVLGPRIDSLTLFRHKPTAVEQSFWHKRTVSVMRRPIPVIVVVATFLLLLGAPFLRIDQGLPDDRVLPPTAHSRAVNDIIRAEFSANEAGAASVVVPSRGGVSDDALGAYAATLSAIPGVSRVDAETGYYINGQRVLPPNELSTRFHLGNATWLSVVPTVEPLSAAGERLISQIRAVKAPFGVAVGGSAAELVDGRAALYERLPIALGIVAVVTFVLLFMMTGSLLVPAKAVVLNLFSLTATFGAVVWVFQDGHLASVLHFTPTGQIDLFTPILMFCIAFGLSMDYEVFMLSRIKEEYDLSHDNDAAVALGLGHTGRIITSAAVLLSVVFITFATSQVAVVKLFGLGLTLAVLVDAFVIRATLVPAFMRLAGRANWWAPRALRRFHLRWGIWESEPLAIHDLAIDREKEKR